MTATTRISATFVGGRMDGRTLQIQPVNRFVAWDFSDPETIEVYRWEVPVEMGQRDERGRDIPLPEVRVYAFDELATRREKNRRLNKGAVLNVFREQP